VFDDLRGKLVSAFQTIPLSTIDCEGSVRGMD
jgi:hypothetical protein